MCCSSVGINIHTCSYTEEWIMTVLLTLLQSKVPDYMYMWFRLPINNISLLVWYRSLQNCSKSVYTSNCSSVYFKTNFRHGMEVLSTSDIISLLAGMSNLQYLTLLSFHTITVLPLTTVYLVSEVHCTSNVLHSITP